jgi:membrane protein YqaA with SNARE-associated domain
MDLRHPPQRLGRFLVSLLGITLFFGAVFYSTSYVNNNAVARELVGAFGYVGVFISAVIAGINILFPAPATALTPIFLSADLDFSLIVVALILGTLVADSIGFLIGVLGKHATHAVHPRFFEKIVVFKRHHDKLIPPVVFLFAALMPLPNEIILIPLALLGYRFKKLIVPLILGTTVHQLLYAYGFSNLFLTIT